MRRGEIWRFEPVLLRAGESTIRLIVSADALNVSDAIPWAYTIKVISEDPRSLLGVHLSGHGWAMASGVERPPSRRLVEKLGETTPAEMEQVDAALRAVFDL